MKNLNLSYVLFGVFVLMVVTIITCGDKTSSKSEIEVLSFPNPEEVKEEVEAKVEEAKKEITTTIEEKVEEIESRIIEVLPEIDIPALKEEKTEETPTEVPTEEVPVETPVEVPSEEPDSLEVE